MWGWGRPRRDLPEVNYRDYETSEDEDDFRSPQRPVNTREGSPVELAIPQLNDNVDEELDQVRQTLQNISHTPLFRQGSQSDSVASEVVVEGHVVGSVGDNLVSADNMPVNPPVVNFEDQDEADEPNALRDACSRLERLQWQDHDINFFFSQIEIKMSLAGVRRNYTKFQALSTLCSD